MGVSKLLVAFTPAPLAYRQEEAPDSAAAPHEDAFPRTLRLKLSDKSKQALFWSLMSG